MDNIKYDDFKNICRICTFTCDLKPIQQDSVIIDVLNNLTGFRFETNDDLPQQLCRKCFEKINEIHAFSFQCKQTYFSLVECANKFKRNRINMMDATNIIIDNAETTDNAGTTTTNNAETNNTKTTDNADKTIEVEDLEIISIKKETMDLDEKIQDSENEITNDENYLINIKTLNCLEEMLLPKNSNIQDENDENDENSNNNASINDLIEDSDSFNMDTSNIQSLEFENTNMVASNKQLLQEIHEKQSQILFRLESIDKKLHENEKSTTNDLSVLPPNLRIKIPLKNMKNFDDFEQFLAKRENMVAMLKYFKVFTTLNVGQSVVNLLKQLLTDELAQNFNFCGKKPKRKFSCTNTEKLIFYTVKSTANCNRDKEYFVSIMNWLKHAPARSKNASKYEITNII